MSTLSKSPVEALHCPMCEYDLRGLVEPRCPECGYRFEWAELRDPARRLHPYLFELHRERNVWSFTRTLLGGLRPRRFWRGMFPTQPSSPRRLILYYTLITLPVVLAFAMTLAGNTRAFIRNNRASRAQLLAYYTTTRNGYLMPGGGVRAQRMVDSTEPLLHWPRALALAFKELRDEPFVLAGMIAFAWPWLTLAALLVFRISMRRARVRAVHMLRCVVYCSDAIVWFNIVTLVCALLWVTEIFAGTPVFTALPIRLYEVVMLGLAGLAGLFFPYRLGTATKYYLRFDHVWATVLATQVIAALAVVVIQIRLFIATYP